MDVSLPHVADENYATLREVASELQSSFEGTSARFSVKPGFTWEKVQRVSLHVRLRDGLTDDLLHVNLWEDGRFSRLEGYGHVTSPAEDLGQAIREVLSDPVVFTRLRALYAISRFR